MCAVILYIHPALRIVTKRSERKEKRETEKERKRARYKKGERKKEDGDGGLRGRLKRLRGVIPAAMPRHVYPVSSRYVMGSGQ